MHFVHLPVTTRVLVIAAADLAAPGMVVGPKSKSRAHEPALLQPEAPPWLVRCCCVKTAAQVLLNCSVFVPPAARYPHGRVA